MTFTLGYVTLPINETIAERAREVQIRMAARGHHRAAGVIDLLTATAAEHHGAQQHVWVAPRGSL